MNDTKSGISYQVVSLLAVSMVLVVIGVKISGNSYGKRFTSLRELVVSEGYMGDLGGVMLGARRLSADIAYIQLLQYYGAATSRNIEIGEEGGEAMGTFFPVKSAPIDTKFFRLKDFGFRIARLDPYFNAAILEVAGSLAFNENRISEALDVLNEAAGRDPSYFRYRLYMAAILYKFKGADRSLIRVLDQAVNEPDCPPVLMNVLANLHKKFGEWREAVQVYLIMKEKSPYESDKKDADKRIAAILLQHPEVRRFFQGVARE